MSALEARRQNEYRWGTLAPACTPGPGGAWDTYRQVQGFNDRQVSMKLQAGPEQMRVLAHDQTQGLADAPRLSFGDHHTEYLYEMRLLKVKST